MAIHSTYFAYCDVPTCLFNCDPGIENDKSKRDLFDDMRSEGWLFKRGKHYCPYCARAMQPSREG